MLFSTYIVIVLMTLVRTLLLISSSPKVQSRNRIPSEAAPSMLPGIGFNEKLLLLPAPSGIGMPADFSNGSSHARQLGRDVILGFCPGTIWDFGTGVDFNSSSSSYVP